VLKHPVFQRLHLLQFVHPKHLHHILQTKAEIRAQPLFSPAETSFIALSFRSFHNKFLYRYVPVEDYNKQVKNSVHPVQSCFFLFPLYEQK
jgi:hypothetical protein